jgi:hypothetical protein
LIKDGHPEAVARANRAIMWQNSSTIRFPTGH